MFTRVSLMVCLALIAVSFGLTGAVYNDLPERMASHWDGADNVNDTASRAVTAFMVPGMQVLMLIILGALVPAVARDRTPKATGRTDIFLIVLFAFFTGIHAQVLAWNLGNEVPFTVTVPIGLGFLFFAIGHMMADLPPNPVMGIRTYWTLKNPVVWARTHERASRMFRILGVLYLFTPLVPSHMLLVILVPVVFLALYLMVYSYVLYQALEQARQD
jgi:uncharacterized membrane protein